MARIGVTPCPNCGQVTITDPNKFVLFFPRGISLPHAEVTCESCGVVYQVAMSWKSAYIFDKKGCPVVGFSPSRGAMFTENDIDEFVGSFDIYMDDFLSIVDEELDEKGPSIEA